MKIDPETILAVVPEYCSGPGWANTPLWIYWRDPGGGEIHQECLQPEEQTGDMRGMFSTLAAAHTVMLRVVSAALRENQLPGLTSAPSMRGK